MADFYCDHGAYASVLGTVPTWGVPQEGDGSTKDAATASSVASIDLTAITSTAGTFSLFGSAAVSVGASASGATLAAQIVSAINGSSITTGNATIFPGAPQLRNAFYARNTGAVLEIMCRVGSAMTNVLGMTWAGTWSAGPPANLTFSGGAGGCWGWLLNGTAIGVSSSIAALGYGILTRPPMVHVAMPTTNDVVWVRSGGNPVINFSGASFYLSRDAAWPLHLVIDSNTKWTGDSATGKIVINLTTSNASTHALWFYGANAYSDVLAYESSLTCLRKGALEFNYATTGGVGVVQFGGAGSAHRQNARVSGVLYADVSTGANALVLREATLGTGGGTFDIGTMRFVDCTFRRVNSVANLLPALFNIPADAGGSIRSYHFTGCSFEANVSGATAPALINMSGVNGGGPSVNFTITFQNCSITGWVTGGHKFQLLSSAPAPLNNYTRIVARDFQGAVFGPTFAGLARAASVFDPDFSSFLLHNPKIGGPFRYENFTGITDFDPDAVPAYPTLAAIQSSGTAWSLRAVWLVTTGVVRRVVGFQPVPIRVAYLDSSAIRTIKLEMFMRSVLLEAIQACDMALTITYVSNTTGNQVNTTITGAPSSSAATWANAASYSDYQAVAYSITTADPVKQGTEISFQLSFFGAPRTASTESIYIDPEPSIT